jgi:hypothetical protein
MCSQGIPVLVLAVMTFRVALPDSNNNVCMSPMGAKEVENEVF